MSQDYVPPKNGFRTFVLVWLTQAVSVFGSALTGFAMTIWLTTTLYPREDQRGELALAIALTSMAFGVTTILLAPIAGAWADRHDRKRTMIMADLAMAGLSFLMLVLMLNGTLNLPILIVIDVFFAMAQGFHGAAFDTSYAMLVPEERLPRANGMMQTVWSLSGILSPAIAAGIVTLPGLARQGIIPGAIGEALAPLRDGVPLAIGMDAVTFFLSAVVLIFLVIPSPKRTDLTEGGKPKVSIWADVRVGAMYIWHRRPMLWLLGTFTVANFAGSPVGVFMPLLVKFNLQPDWSSRGMAFEGALALVSTLFSLGGLIGGIFISTWGGLKKRRVYGVLVPMIIAGMAQMVFGLSPLIYLTAGMAIVINAMLPILNAHSQAIWQSITPRELQGRVFSVRRVIAQFSWPLSTAIAGILGGLFNPGIVVAALAAIYVLFCTAQLFNRQLLRVEDKAYLEDLASRASGAAAAEAVAASGPLGAAPAMTDERTGMPAPDLADKTT